MSFSLLSTKQFIVHKNTLFVYRCLFLFPSSLLRATTDTAVGRCELCSCFIPMGLHPGLHYVGLSALADAGDGIPPEHLQRRSLRYLGSTTF